MIFAMLKPSCLRMTCSCCLKVTSFTLLRSKLHMVEISNLQKTHQCLPHRSHQSAPQKATEIWWLRVLASHRLLDLLRYFARISCKSSFYNNLWQLFELHCTVSCTSATRTLSQHRIICGFCPRPFVLAFVGLAFVTLS